MQETITNTFVTKEKDGKLEVTMTASISAYEPQKTNMSSWKRRFYSFAWHSRIARVLGNMYEELLKEEKAAGSKVNARHQKNESSVM